MIISAKGTSHSTRRLLPAALLLSSVLAVTTVVAQSQSETAAAASKARALLQLPDADYRRDWVLLGSF